jgi:anti-sigma regulatory factor (Ser/Thr protein kinase)
VRRSRRSEVLIDVAQEGHAAVDGERSGEERADRAFRHEILLHAGEDGFREATLPLITDALAARQPLLVAVGDERIRMLEEALGTDAERVRFTDIHTLGRNPARIIPAWREFLERHAPGGRPPSGIIEPIWPGRSQAEVAECERHESLLNLAFEEEPASRLVCAYDVASLDERIIEAAMQNHPFVNEHRVSRRSDAYLDMHGAPRPFEGPLPDPCAQPVELTFTRDELGWLRSCVACWATNARLGAERTERLVLSVSELATNSVRYGGGRGVVRMWREDETLICEVRDRGRIEDPMTGRVAPKPDQLAGRGVWFVNQLCDLVQVRSTSAGSVVRVHMRLP